MQVTIMFCVSNESVGEADGTSLGLVVEGAAFGSGELLGALVVETFGEAEGTSMALVDGAVVVGL
jgi:hypothetical protein